MLASICLVPFNNTQYFFRVMTQLLSTDFIRYETIVIDNSTNPIHRILIWAICKMYKSRLNVRHFRGLNKSLSSATNRAATIATSKYLVYLCSNHTWIYDNGWLRYMVGEMEKNQADIGGTISMAVRPHVQGGLFIVKTMTLLSIPFNEKQFPMSFMDVELAQRFEYRKKKFLHLSKVFSIMGRLNLDIHAEWTKTKDVVICHSHLFGDPKWKECK